MANDIYTPDTISDVPFPGQEETTLDTSDSGNEVYSPTRISQKPYPSRRPAVEVLSSALNTQARRITDQFQFQQNGAIQIGQYISGQSGEMRLSPAGITARNTSGNTTFAIDGETGNATFAGTIQAGAVIAGIVTVGNGTWVIDGDSSTPRIILYNSDIPEIVIGEV